jgi:hypothetical protein
MEASQRGDWKQRAEQNNTHPKSTVGRYEGQGGQEERGQTSPEQRFKRICMRSVEGAGERGAVVYKATIETSGGVQVMIDPSVVMTVNPFRETFNSSLC